MRFELSEVRRELNSAEHKINEQRDVIATLQRRETFRVSEHTHPVERQLHYAERKLEQAFKKIDEQANAFNNFKRSQGWRKKSPRKFDHVSTKFVPKSCFLFEILNFSLTLEILNISF